MAETRIANGSDEHDGGGPGVMGGTTVILADAQKAKFACDSSTISCFIELEKSVTFLFCNIGDWRRINNYTYYLTKITAMR